MYLTLLNCASKNGSDRKFYIMFILSQFFKNSKQNSGSDNREKPVYSKINSNRNDK